MRTREVPFRSIERAHRTATVAHLGNIAYWLKRRLRWDPVKEEFTGDEEATGSALYESTLAAIKSEARRMKVKRAKEYYKQIRNLALRVGPRSKKYYDPTKPQYSLTANSSFGMSPSRYFIIPALSVVNLLATPAKEPAVKVPTVKEIQASSKRPRR